LFTCDGMIWRARNLEFCFPRPAVLMGVLNVTPDSFFDGGRFAEVEAAVEQGLRLVEEGAEIIDVGGESTRPGAVEVEAKEELRRVIPVIERLAGKTKALISIDTQKPDVAREAVAAGARIINNVAANRCDPTMWEVAAGTGAGYIAMHMQGTPQTMQKAPHYDDVVRELRDFFADQLERMEAAGVRTEQICFDVGIGFGKTLEHNLQLLARIEETRVAGRPMTLGVSRKSFLGRLLNLPSEQRLEPAVACAIWAAGRGVEIFRTHDVAETLAGLRMFEAIRNEQRGVVA
jgi:dihydropteroate synthase